MYLFPYCFTSLDYDGLSLRFRANYGMRNLLISMHVLHFGMILRDIILNNSMVALVSPCLNFMVPKLDHLFGITMKSLKNMMMDGAK
ncbi:hypothetical protein FXO38_33795 [Capsicum annuum]|nr:hypothetical protein FXO38_33795 [Capsicum annuum]KAF3667069.1 hypothetical protein FXO37_10200 [Capsicum annuum]